MVRRYPVERAERTPRCSATDEIPGLARTLNGWLQLHMFDTFTYNWETFLTQEPPAGWLNKQAAMIADNGTRLWIYCAPGGKTELEVNADSSQDFNATFNFP